MKLKRIFAFIAALIVLSCSFSVFASANYMAISSASMDFEPEFKVNGATAECLIDNFVGPSIIEYEFIDGVETWRGATSSSSSTTDLTGFTEALCAQYDYYTGRQYDSIFGGRRTYAYYCHPYSAFERGRNENNNRYIRRWYPKGTDFDNVTDAEIEQLNIWVNSYIRLFA